MSQAAKVLYTARTRTSGGRENGVCAQPRRPSGRQAFDPGTARIGTNPEQLFAAGWSACLESAIALGGPAEKNRAAGRHRRSTPKWTCARRTAGTHLSARLNVSLPGVERAAAQALLDEAHESCPYSKATRGNIDVAIKLGLEWNRASRAVPSHGVEPPALFVAAIIVQ